MDKIVTGLVLAGISGITFVAYRHPQAYEKLWGWLALIDVLVVLGIVIWNTSSYATNSAVIKFLKSDQWKEADDAVTKVRVQGSILIGLVVLSFYLQLLLYLPAILGITDTDK